MDTLQRINKLFENVKTVVKQKVVSERLQGMMRDLQNLNTELIVLGKQNQHQFVRSVAMEGYLALLTAKTMPISIMQKKNVLQTAFDKLKPMALAEECLFIFLRVQNLLCYFLIQLEQTALAKDILEGMEEIYDKISKCHPERCLDAEDLFTTEPVSDIKPINPDKIDRVVTNNIQMQAFLYNKLNHPEKYTIYNHTALRRQLEMKEGTPQDWALRAARLGNYFTFLNQLANARHHLCAAYHVLRSCHDNCKLVPAEFVSLKADFEMHFLELSHHWVKYGLTLFKLSKKKILKRYFAKTTCTNDMWQTVDLQPSEQYQDTAQENMKDLDSEKNEKGDFVNDKIFNFPSLDFSEIEYKVPLNAVENVEEARKLFSFTYKWLKRTKHYYDFESHSAQHIACSLQLAELYEHLAFFEKNIDKQYTLQKKRADVLETLNSLLKSCDNVMSVQIDVIRELSQVQLELMALNLQKLWREESHTNVLNIDIDSESIINSLDSKSSKTLTEKTLNASSRNMYLRKMEAATAINGKLFRLSGQLSCKSPSQISFAMKN